MRQEWLAFLSAVQFLTRLPVPDPGWEEGRMDRAAKWFPAVGVLVGTFCGMAFWIGNTVWSGWIAAVLAVAVGVVITGALHEDGLADTADGIGGGRDRLKRLEIMRDSRIGSYGALALILVMSLKLSLITGLTRFPAIEAAAILITAHAISRAAMTLTIRSLPYARTDPSPLSGDSTLAQIAVILVTVALALTPLLFVFGIATVATAIIATSFAALAVRWVLARSLGGWTGDGAGAAQQISEVAFLLGAAATWN